MPKLRQVVLACSPGGPYHFDGKMVRVETDGVFLSPTLGGPHPLGSTVSVLRQLVHLPSPPYTLRWHSPPWRPVGQCWDRWCGSGRWWTPAEVLWRVEGCSRMRACTAPPAQTCCSTLNKHKGTPLNKHVYIIVLNYYITMHSLSASFLSLLFGNRGTQY